MHSCEYYSGMQYYHDGGKTLEYISPSQNFLSVTGSQRP